MREKRQGLAARLLLGVLPAILAACAPAAVPGPDLRGPACGNGILDGGEECDDGNASNDDGCLISCYAPARFVASDPHVHSRGCLLPPTTPPQLMQLLAAEGIQLGAALVWGDGYEADRLLFTGGDHPASAGGHILHYDLEVSGFAADRTGHLVVQGLRDLRFSPDPFLSPKSGLSIPPWAKAQGERVVVGMSHGQFWSDSGFRSPPVVCCMPWEFPIQAVRGGVSFLVTERRGDGPPIDAGTFLLWRTLLNSGFRLALLGSSDYPCVHREIDETTPRSDVIVSGAVTYEAWLEGIRRGRTVVTLDARHHLNLRVNGAPLGSDVTARAGEVLLVSLESEAPEPTVVELLINGVPNTRIALPAGRQVATLRLGLPGSAWISARTPRAATSPVYVVVDGKPIRASPGDTCYLIKYVDHLSGLVSSRQIDLAEDTPFALDAYATVRAELEKRFREAGGQVCF
jgi:cysteine-rich repeat protein